MRGHATSESTTAALAIADAALELAACGVPAPHGDALALCAHVLDTTPMRLALAPATRITTDQRARLVEQVERRRGREPLAYILGRARFRRLELAVDRRVGIPGSGADSLVAVALELPPHGRVHDVGTGAGAIALAIKHERPDLVVSGSDISGPAIDVARLNACSNGLDVVFEVARGLPGRGYDLVVCAPPWADPDGRVVVPTPEGRFEPRLAVYGGCGGLDVVREVVDDADPGTRIALLHAPEQSAPVAALLCNTIELEGAIAETHVTFGTVP